MGMHDPDITVEIVNYRWLRLIVVKHDGTVWTGDGWSCLQSEALLYANPRKASEAASVLEQWFRKKE